MNLQIAFDLGIMGQFKDLPGFDPDIRAWVNELTPKGEYFTLEDMMQTNSLKTLVKGIDRRNVKGIYPVLYFLQVGP